MTCSRRTISNSFVACPSTVECTCYLFALSSVLFSDASSRETGLNLAVATMRPGERSLVYVTDPFYGYGERGSFSFPSVPPSCQLLYEVDMLTWEPPAEVIVLRRSSVCADATMTCASIPLCTSRAGARVCVCARAPGREARHSAAHPVPPPLPFACAHTTWTCTDMRKVSLCKTVNTHTDTYLTHTHTNTVAG